jgi:hypothetical protein
VRRPLAAVFRAVILAAAAVVGFYSVGTGFLPKADEGGFVIDYLTPAGSSLEDTDRQETPPRDGSRHRQPTDDGGLLHLDEEDSEDTDEGDERSDPRREAEGDRREKNPDRIRVEEKARPNAVR